MTIDAYGTSVSQRRLFPPADLRRIARLCADCAEGLREEAERHPEPMAEALCNLATAVEHAAADLMADHGGRPL